jgi:hypothetical protein
LSRAAHPLARQVHLPRTNLLLPHGTVGSNGAESAVAKEPETAARQIRGGGDVVKSATAALELVTAVLRRVFDPGD